MGKYSVRGSTAFDERIDADMERISGAVQASKFSKHWKALVLLGGYGRGEGSPFIQRSGVRGQESGDGSQESGVRGQESAVELPFNDYDLIVVTDTVNPQIRAELKALEKRLTEETGLPVDLYPYLESSLPKCEFSLLNYEMKNGHRVIFGDEDILSAMPDYPHNAIPLSEGTRLLMNRGKLLLDIKRRLAQPEPLTVEERHRFLKFMFKSDLACGDCDLLINRKYNISYTVKKMESLVCRDVTSAYLQAIVFKEWTDFQGLENCDLQQRFEETQHRWQTVFLWFEGRRLRQSFQTLEHYAQFFPNLGKEGSPLKNAAHNLRAFGPCALPALFAHPRLRLYAALPLLLNDSPDCSRIKKLLCSQEDDFEGLCKKFYALQQRFS